MAFGRLASLVSALIVVSALGSAESPQLDVSNFDELVKEARLPWVVEFYSDMCESCQEFAPVWHAFADEVEKLGNIRLGRCNVDSKAGSQLASQLKVMDGGIPQVVFFPAPHNKPTSTQLRGETQHELKSSLKKLFRGAKDL
ncbi:thioredoxin-like protein [Pelagophyceae sp. CCMP2097]|nr:thioredoxin-like protein [Pelagophyceae sp. CCMP2097]